MDDVEGSAVFDAAARILKLGFAEDFASGGFADLVQADKRRFANCCSGLLGKWNLWVQVERTICKSGFGDTLGTRDGSAPLMRFLNLRDGELRYGACSSP